MGNWMCSVHSDFSEMLLLKKFLSGHVDLNCSDQLEKDELVISQKCRNGQELELQKLRWNEVYTYFEKYVIGVWNNNYDYYYLKYAQRDCQQGGYDTLVVGSSYARFGYDEKMSNGRAKNLSLPSQDLYYASKIADQILDSNNAIKNIVIGMGYYYFNSDLSRTENVGELSRISTVYEPLFGDVHNALILPETVGIRKSSFWDIESILEYFSETIYRAISTEYFSAIHRREQQRTVMWPDATKGWSELSEKEREEAGRRRVGLHNKGVSHKETYAENIEILNELVDRCNKRGVRVTCCVFPASREYMSGMDTQIKEEFWKALENIRGEIHVIDLNECDGFEIKDFNDMDHLSESGAHKATEIINSVIWN